MRLKDPYSKRYDMEQAFISHTNMVHGYKPFA
jgi:hypothetical protein